MKEKFNLHLCAVAGGSNVNQFHEFTAPVSQEKKPDIIVRETAGDKRPNDECSSDRWAKEK